MSKKIYSNHDKVLKYGQSQVDRYIKDIDKYEQWGTMNALICLREGVDIVFRLGTDFDKEVLVSRLRSKLDQMNVDSDNYLTSEDKSAMSHLDHTRRIHAIELVKSYIEFEGNMIND